ncbi:MAG: c-type cytochrome [Candidatus Baltobacteraceae bacterium]
MIGAVLLAAATQYLIFCSSCHGARLEGSTAAPPLTNVSVGLVDFELRTGRMPALVPREQNDPSAPQLHPEQIASIEAYIASRTSGDRAIPAAPRILAGVSALRAGRSVYEENCEQCHAATGRGDGATAYHEVAPSLMESDPQTIVEAVREGPNIMPKFGTGVIDDPQLADLTGYVRYLQRNQYNAGGAALANWGPTAEGFFAWVLGLGALIFFTRRIGEA